ncbi:MAG TPA: D-alanine--D-alanine ligase [Pirellulales bacterium]|nr:D-alanine--D-alanine ligase [Pirellulales bacterium]
MRVERADGALHVAVLAGGDSAEREVSLASGRNVVAALAQRGHDVEWLDPALRDLASVPWDRFDVGFVALHGGAGEDGRVHAQLESWGVPCTGSGPVAASLAMSKSASKTRMLAAGVPTLPYVSFAVDEPRSLVAERVAELGYPTVVKPDAQGSSLGVGFAADAGELAVCIDAARCFGTLMLAEPWIDGREFTVAVLGREPLPVLEIATPRGLFDYEAKYRCTATEYRFETGLPPEIVNRVRSAATAAVEALGTAGLARVDLMLSRVGDPWVLEVNTVPGMTDHSLAPMAAARAGLTFADLCDWMLRDALTRADRRDQRIGGDVVLRAADNETSCQDIVVAGGRA